MKTEIIIFILKTLTLLKIIKGSYYREVMVRLYVKESLRKIQENECPATWKGEEI